MRIFLEGLYYLLMLLAKQQILSTLSRMIYLLGVGNTLKPTYDHQPVHKAL